VTRSTVVGALLAVLALGGAGLWAWSERAAEAREREAAAARRAEERRTEAEAHWAAVREESRPILPAVAGGLALGMPRSEVLERVGGLAPMGGDAARSDDRDLEAYATNLPGGRRMVALFGRDDARLKRVQLLGTLPGPQALGPHLQALNDTYGRPSGSWDCPVTGQHPLPTRRFTWRGEHVVLVAILLVVGDRVSTTLDVAEIDRVAASLRRSRCHPTASEDLGEIPRADPRVIQAQLPPGGGPRPAPAARGNAAAVP
jgi:hypothetical protein